MSATTSATVPVNAGPPPGAALLPVKAGPLPFAAMLPVDLSHSPVLGIVGVILGAGIVTLAGRLPAPVYGLAFALVLLVVDAQRPDGVAPFIYYQF